MFEPETDNQPSVERDRLSAIYRIENNFYRSDSSVTVDLSRIAAISEARMADKHRDFRFVLWMDGGEPDGILVSFRQPDKLMKQHGKLNEAWKAYRDQRP